ncbi:MAG: alpha/beta fold hydrolase [Rubrobacter sp.]|nr:alpha/beta fold hydrolase [Rubrobacter sp.]
MSGIIIAILVLVCVFVAASIALSRTTQAVENARDTEYLELEGNWVRYSVTGGGPPVVLVHGWLSSSRVWEPLASRLAQRFTVYALDLAGFGDSDKPISGYGIRYGSRLLYAFCAHFGLTRVTVVGHDIGGTMAVKLAADHPDVVGRLVLVAAPADEDQVDLPTLLWLATLPVVGPVFYTLGRFLRPLRRLWMRSFVLDPQDLTEEVVDDAGKSTPAAVDKTLSVTRREISRGRLARQAGVIKIPVLLVAGEEDQIVNPRAVDDWSRTFSAEVVSMNDCGHLPMLEHAGEFNAQVLAFLTGDPRYRDAAPEPQEEAIDVPETPGEQGPFARAEPETENPDGFPATDRDLEGARDSHDAPEPATDQDSERTAGDDDAEERPQGRAEGGGEASGHIPEMPEDLFDWPESLKESRSQDRSRETGRRVDEERDEAVDPEAVEEDDPRS